MKRLVAVVAATLLYSTVNACDICGCGVGSYYIGILPEFKKKIVGVRYRYSSLLTHLGAGGTRSYLTTTENYHTAEVWGGWTIGKKVRLMGYIPVSSIHKTNQSGQVSRTGLGDAGIQGFYRVFSKTASVKPGLMVHSLWVGAGLKLPTGKYEAPRDVDQQGPNVFQLGTASWDMTFNAMYDLRVQDIGLNTTLSYKINSGNRFDYQYGDKLSGTTQLYYKLRVKNKMTIAPNIGATYEKAQKDIHFKNLVDVSGGEVVFGSLGAELSFSRLSIGGNWQTPLHQDLAGGFVRSFNKGMVHVSFAF